MSSKLLTQLTSASRTLLIAMVVLVLLPFILAAAVVWMVLWVLASVVFYILVWLFWCTRGKDILFVYSDSPIWHDYVEEHILPRIESRSVVLNWSDRRYWLRKWTLAPLLFRHFGGQQEYNPLAIYFPPFWFHQTFRFWQPFRDWKHGKPEKLKQLENDFFESLARTHGIGHDTNGQMP